MTFSPEEDEAPRASFSCSSLLPSAIKVAFAKNCHAFPHGAHDHSPDENLGSDLDDERVIILAVRSRMTKARLRRKNKLKIKNVSWVWSPSTGDFFLASKPPVKEEEKQVQKQVEEEEEDEEEENESFYSAKTRFSRSSNSSRADCGRIGRRSVIEELCHCQGWPFGLYRKSLMLPPLPQSPSESWSWCKGRATLKHVS